VAGVNRKMETSPIKKTVSLAYNFPFHQASLARYFLFPDTASANKKLYLADPGEAGGCSTNSLIIN
jgi:hypothetical protein